MTYKSVAQIIEGLKNRDWIALGKAITIVENGYEGKEQILDYAYENSSEASLVLGITGTGGAGKSTTIDGLIDYYVKQGKRIGVIAVDPSSSLTGGAVLGDRVRMSNKFMCSDLFIRSFASRGSLGGISQGAKDVLYLYKAFLFDIIIVESYGVGQAETDINHFVDVSVVLMVPGNGDHIQLAKAGIREIADVFVVNKADNQEAELLYASLIDSFDILPIDRRPAVLKTIARDGVGIPELAQELISRALGAMNGRMSKKKGRILNEITTNAYQYFAPYLKEEAEHLVEEVLKGNSTPFKEARKLGSRICLR